MSHASHEPYTYCQSCTVRLNFLQVSPYNFIKLHNFLQILMMPSANDFRFPQRVDFRETTATLVSLFLELSLEIGEMKATLISYTILLERIDTNRNQVIYKLMHKTVLCSLHMQPSINSCFRQNTYISSKT